MAPERLPWFKCFPEKFLNAIAGLDPFETALYTIIIMRIYDVGGPIADDVRALSTRANMTPARTQRVVDRLIEIGKIVRGPDGRFSNPVAEQTIARSAEERERTRQKNSAAANSRWRKPEQNQPNGHASALPNDASKTPLDLELPLLSNESNGHGSVQAKPKPSPDAEYFARGRELLGNSAGGLLQRVLVAKDRNVALARSAIEMASTKTNPREYLGAIIKGATEAAAAGRPYWDPAF